MEKIHGNMHIFVLSCKFLTCKHKNMHVSMYFLHLEHTFTPHYIITDKGQLCISPCMFLILNANFIQLLECNRGCAMKLNEPASCPTTCVSYTCSFASLPKCPECFSSITLQETKQISCIS